jgi:hypothetical protein
MKALPTLVRGENMKEKQETPKPVENKSKLKMELAATKTIHDALLSVDEERRGPIIQAVAILLRIYIPRD